MNKCVRNPLLEKQKNTIANRCTVIFICFAMCLTVFSCFVPTLFAADSDDGTTAQIVDCINEVSPGFKDAYAANPNTPLPALDMYDSLDSIDQGAYNWAEAVYGGDVFDDTFNKYLSLKLPTAETTLEEQSDNYFMRAVGIVSSMLPVATSLGIGLLCVWFLVDLLSKATADSFTVEHFVKGMMKFVVGYLVLTNLISLSNAGTYEGLVPTIINGVADIVDSLRGSDVAGVTVTVNSPLTKIWYKLYTQNFLAALGVILDLLLPSLFTTLSRVLIRAFALGRIIELSLLIVLSPIAVSNIFGDASHDQNYGVKYLKKLAAVELQGLIMYYCVLVGTNIQGAMSGGNVVGIVAVVCVEAALIARSRNVANEILGVH